MKELKKFLEGLPSNLSDEQFKEKVKLFNQKDLNSKGHRNTSSALFFPIVLKNHTIIGGATFEDYKTAIDEQLKNNYSTIDGIKEFYSKNVIEKYKVTKNTKPIYDKLIAGIEPKPSSITNDLSSKYAFYSLVQSVEEVIKLEKYLKDLNPHSPKTEKDDEVYKTRLLFKVGLLFAKGEMNKYFTVNSKGETVMNNGFTAPKIAKELGNGSYNKYILATINNYTPDKENGSKNIFNSFDMMNKIIAHCEAENIAVDTYFRSRLPTE